MGYNPAVRQCKTASDRMLRGRSPWGLGGAVYLLIYLFVHALSVRRCKRSLMLSVRGRGTLDSVYIREDYTGLE